MALASKGVARTFVATLASANFAWYTPLSTVARVPTRATSFPGWCRATQFTTG